MDVIRIQREGHPSINLAKLVIILGNFSQGMKDDMMGRLVEVCSSDVRPFIESIENVSSLYNEPVMLMADEGAVYVMPGNAVTIDAHAA